MMNLEKIFVLYSSKYGTSFFLVVYVSIGGGVGRFVPVVMLVERGDATGALGHFLILVSHSQFHYIVLCVSLVKMIVNTCGF
jgi:hypothetical protein